MSCARQSEAVNMIHLSVREIPASLIILVPSFGRQPALTNIDWPPWKAMVSSPSMHVVRPGMQDAAPGAQHTRVEVLVPPQSQAWMAKQPGVTDLQAAMTAVLQAAMTALNPQQSQLFQVPGLPPAL